MDWNRGCSSNTEGQDNPRIIRTGSAQRRSNPEVKQTRPQSANRQQTGMMISESYSYDKGGTTNIDHINQQQPRSGVRRAAPVIVSGNESPPIGAQRTKQQTRPPSAQSRQQLGLVDTQGEENQFPASHGLVHSQQKRF
ncbi:MAG: hypothetical protein EZS28_032311 [Streblomastix strix]|uniref:Uncharacterized protein n=1 Tax=Streblomastix strix TaxID=222440 RepID=A0A5J4UPA7_9EUKA|nr:MAG: hypothetical protein EZS28_032311 [Streblomastix strix]